MATVSWVKTVSVNSKPLGHSLPSATCALHPIVPILQQRAQVHLWCLISPACHIPLSDKTSQAWSGPADPSLHSFFLTPTASPPDPGTLPLNTVTTAGSIARWSGVWALEPDCLGSNPGFANFELWKLELFP